MPKIPKDTEMRISSAFQHRLQELIADTELNNAGFASAAGISKDVITRAVIYGIIPALRSLIKIADYLNISIGYLLAENDEANFYRAEIPQSFETRVKELAAEKGEKLSGVAAIMPFAKNSFSEWFKKGTLPSLEYLKALAEHFHVSIDYLLGRTDDK